MDCIWAAALVDASLMNLHADSLCPDSQDSQSLGDKTISWALIFIVHATSSRLVFTVCGMMYGNAKSTTPNMRFMADQPACWMTAPQKASFRDSPKSLLKCFFRDSMVKITWSIPFAGAAAGAPPFIRGRAMVAEIETARRTPLGLLKIVETRLRLSASCLLNGCFYRRTSNKVSLRQRVVPTAKARAQSSAEAKGFDLDQARSSFQKPAGTLRHKADREVHKVRSTLA